MKKRWFDDWRTEVTSNGEFKVDLPHSYGKEKSIHIKGKYTRKHIHWLVMALDCALTELTKK